MTKLEYEKKALELRKMTGQTPGDEFINDSHIAMAMFLIESINEEDPLWIFGHIFQAGKTEGIRKERARRKEKLAKAKKNEEVTYSISYDERASLINKFWNIEYSLSQITGITSSVGDALYSGNDGTEYAPTLSLASSELKKQQKQIQKLTDFVLKEIAKQTI